MSSFPGTKKLQVFDQSGLLVLCGLTNPRRKASGDWQFLLGGNGIAGQLQGQRIRAAIKFAQSVESLWGGLLDLATFELTQVRV